MHYLHERGGMGGLTLWDCPTEEAELWNKLKDIVQPTQAVCNNIRRHQADVSVQGRKSVGVPHWVSFKVVLGHYVGWIQKAKLLKKEDMVLSKGSKVLSNHRRWKCPFEAVRQCSALGQSLVSVAVYSFYNLSELGGTRLNSVAFYSIC